MLEAWSIDDNAAMRRPGCGEPALPIRWTSRAMERGWPPRHRTGGGAS
jgi:hypothetical protein